MIGMDTMVNQNIRFVGIDDSQEMLDKCKSKLLELGFSRDYELRCADLNKGVKITNASVVVTMSYTSVCPSHLPRTAIEKYL